MDWKTVVKMLIAIYNPTRYFVYLKKLFLKFI